MLYTVSILAILVGTATSAVVFNNTFFYDSQDMWQGLCSNENSMRQSPINIVTANVNQDKNLMPLKLSSSWMTPYDGVFHNEGGVSMRFTADVDTFPTTTTHLGTYNLMQFHFHWGRMTGEGSEHQINGEPADMEVHLFHIIEGGTDVNDRSFFANIAVLADVDENAPLTGIWEQLNIPEALGHLGSERVTGIRYDDLLPENRDYYYYEGSLTVPTCIESMNWFILKERIVVPGRFLQLLRTMEETENGERIQTFNFRMPQDLAGRTVTTPASSQALKPIISLLALCLVAIKLM